MFKGISLIHYFFFMFLIFPFLLGCKASESIDALIGNPDDQKSITPYLVSAPSAGTYESVALGDSVSQSFVITNVSVKDSTVSLVSLIGSAFTLSSNECFGKTLAAGTGTCQIDVIFNPTVAGSHVGSAAITLASGFSLTIPLTGKGVLLTPILTPSPGSAAYGTVTVGSTVALPITMTNTGGLSASVASATVTGTAFSIASNSCSSTTVLSNGSCAIALSFAPASATAYAETLTLAYTGAGGTGYVTTLALTGLGAAAAVPPSLAASPSTKNFGNVATNVTTTQTFTITNTSGVTALTQTGSVSGAGYTISASTCNSAVLSAGATCSVTVRFAPVTQTSLAGTFSLPYTASTGGSTYTLSTSLTGAGVAPSVSFSFNGFNAGVGTHASGLTSTGVTLNWSAPTSGTAAYFKIFKTVGGVTSSTSAISGSTILYIFSGLTPNTTYTFKINAYDSLDVSDGNTNTVDVTTPNVVGANFNGWSDVVAWGSVNSSIGTYYPALDSDTLLSVRNAVAVAQIAWETMTISPSGAPSGHNIYRANGASPSWPGDFTLLASIGTTRQYIDSTVVNSTTYTYRVVPVVAGSEVIPAATTDTFISVFVPAANMALAHRWILNRDVCMSLLGKTWPAGIDRDNNYRCSYNWGSGFAPQIGAMDKTVWDIGRSLVVDRWTAGCRASTYSNAGPSGGVDGDIYFQKGAASGAPEGWGQWTRCYKKSSSNWYSFESGSLTYPEKNTMAIYEPGFPPIASTQAAAAFTCQQRSPAGVGSLRLMRMHEKIAISAWNGVFINPSPALLSIITSGTDHTNFGSCNVNRGDTISLASEMFLPRYEYVFTNGSWATRNCVSRYGIQDFVGNIAEWTGDQFINCSTSATCTGAVSVLDPGAVYLEGFVFDGTMGVAIANNGSTTTSTRIPMLGLPTPTVSGALGSISLDTAITTGDAVAIAHNSLLLGVASNTETLGGRMQYTSTTTGRFNFGLFNSAVSTDRAARFGFRCVGQVGP